MVSGALRVLPILRAGEPAYRGAQQPRVGANPLLRRADRIIALSDYAAHVMATYGVPQPRLAVVPNGIPGARRVPRPSAGARFAAVGRLRAERASRDCWRRGRRGHRWMSSATDHNWADSATGACRSGVPGHHATRGPSYPSAEVLRRGLSQPVARAGGGAGRCRGARGGRACDPRRRGQSDPDLVAAGVGVAVARVDSSFSPGALSDALRWTVAGGAALRSHCRAVYSQRYDVDRWVARLLDVYDEARRSRAH